jgi:hypothetical protein
VLRSSTVVTASRQYDASADLPFYSRTVFQAQGMRLMPWRMRRVGCSWFQLTRTLLSDGAGACSSVATGCRCVLLIELTQTLRRHAVILGKHRGTLGRGQCTAFETVW